MLTEVETVLRPCSKDTVNTLMATINARGGGPNLFETAALPPDQLGTLLGLLYPGPMEVMPWSSAH